MSNIKNKIKNNSIFIGLHRFVFRLFRLNKIKGGRNNSIKIDGIMKRAKIEISGKNNQIIIRKPKSNIKLNVFIKGNNNKIIIDERCVLNGLSCWIEDDGNEINIGKETMVCRPIRLMSLEGCKILIGERCMFAEGVNFRTSDSHSILNLHNERINAPADIILHDHVWVGYHSLVLKGVSIPKNSIVGAKSVVCKTFTQEGIVIAGSPAKIVKTDINWDYNRVPMGESFKEKE